MECSIIRDLIRLFLKDTISEESEASIKEHVKDCESCNKEFEQAQQNKSAEVEFLKLAKRIKKRNRRTFIAISLSVAFVIVFVINIKIALDTGKPLIAFWKTEISEDNGNSTITTFYSLGSRVDSYKIKDSKVYSRLHLPFAPKDEVIKLSSDEFGSLKLQVGEMFFQEDSRYREYFKTVSLVDFMIYDVA